MGKATAGSWFKRDFCAKPASARNKSIEARARERRECTRKFLKDDAPDYNSGFWQFARMLNVAAAAKWNQSNLELQHPLCHITWTNICKIGVVGEKPPREGSIVFTKQRELAVETLRLEISSYKPKLICFATGDYADDVLAESIRDPDYKLWDRKLNKAGVWLRRPKCGLPAIVWIGHPGRTSTATRQKWLMRISELLPA